MSKKVIGWIDVSCELMMHWLSPAATRLDGKAYALKVVDDPLPSDFVVEYTADMPGRTVRIGFSGPGVEARQYKPTLKVIACDLKDT